MAVSAVRAREALNAVAREPISGCAGLYPSVQSIRPAVGTIDRGLTRHVMGYQASDFYAIRRFWHGLAMRMVTDTRERRELFDHLSCRMRNYQTTPTRVLA